MKKIISLVLSLALVACMFSMSVMAADDDVSSLADVVYTGKVGSHGTNAENANSYMDGIPEIDFTTKTFNKAVELILGVSESRYAVDIEFSGNYYFNISGLVWDVNKLEYVTSNSNTVSTITEDQTYGFKIINYSDNAIHIDASSSGSTYLDEASLTIDFASTIVCSNCNGIDHTDCDFVKDDDASTETSICGELEGNNSGDTEANWVEFSASLAVDDGQNWADAINTLIEAHGQASLVLTQFTISVQPTTTVPASH